MLGAFVAGALRRQRWISGTRRSIAAAAASLLVIAAAIGFLLPTSAPDVRAAVELREVAGAGTGGPGSADATGPEAGDERTVVATVRFDPAGAAETDVNWLTTIAWQGGEPLRVEPLERIGEGVYRSAPVPVGGSWKTMVRLHRGRELAGLPIYLPADPAIPVAGVAAAPRFERAFVRDHELLQRERLDDVPGWLWGAAGLVVLALTAALLALIGWALVRIARSQEPVAPAPAPQPERAEAAAVTA